MKMFGTNNETGNETGYRDWGLPIYPESELTQTLENVPCQLLYQGKS